MRILLVNTPAGDVYGDLNSAAGCYFPLGLAYISGYLKQQGHTVLLLDPDAQALSFDTVIEKVKEFQPALIGLNALTPNFNIAARYAAGMKKTCQATIVLGGVHASALPKDIISAHPQFDYAVIGEGEHTIQELVAALESGQPDHCSIRGLAFRKDNDTVVTAPRPFINDVDSLPFPDRTQIPLSNYHLHKHMSLGLPHADMLTSRGCPFSCIFCASHLTLGKTYRPHSPGYVLAEIRYLTQTHGIKHLVFQDDTFTLDRSRVVEICDRIISGKLDIKWSCWARVNTVDRELLTLMKRAGCFSVGYGVESADPEVLKLLRKGITPRQCVDAFRISHELGLKTLGFFILGCPGDSVDTMQKTIDFSIRLNPAIALFSKLIPYPGTELYSRYAAAGKKWESFTYFGGAADPIRHESNVNIDAVCALANRRFYFRASYLIKLLRSFRSWAEIASFASGGRALVKHLLKPHTDSALARAKERYRGISLWQDFYIWFRTLTCPFEHIEPFIPVTGAIIDVGCGSGFLSILLALKRPEASVMGIDRNKKAIDLARKVTSDIRNLSFQTKDLTELSLHSCDTIVISDVLHHLPRKIQSSLLDEIADKLKPRGTLIIKDINTRPLWKYLWHYMQDLAYTREPLFCNSIDDFKKMLASRGFTVSIVPLDHWYPYPHVLMICTKKEQATYV